jgi:type IV secretory pathway TrbF-like protein
MKQLKSFKEILTSRISFGSSRSPEYTLAAEGEVAPFRFSKDAWNHIIGDPAKQAQKWQLCCFLLLGVVCFQAYQLSQASHGIRTESLIAVYNEQDDTFLPVSSISSFKERNIAPRDIKARIADFIRNARTVSRDQVVVSRSLYSALAYLIQNKSEARFQKWFRTDKNGSIERIKRGETVEVHVQNVKLIPESDTYGAVWKETVYDNRSRVIDTYVMYGYFNISHLDISSMKMSRNEKEKRFQANPLGIYIRDYSWSIEKPQWLDS